MLSRERVAAVIRHERPDRMPIYGWVKINLEEQIAGAFGSLAAFEDHYEFDLAHLFGGPVPYERGALDRLRAESGGAITPRDLLDLTLNDPDDQDAYADVIAGIRHHQTERGRFVYMQTPGIFECLNGPFEVENHLLYVALYEDDLHDVYRRQAAWNRQFAMNCLDLGVDMIHVSDDWGAQRGLLFHPDTWRRLIYPYHQVTCEAVRKRDAFLSLHSDGNISQVLDGIVDLGYMVVHPWQESAGMNLQNYRDCWADHFVIMGGLDVQTTIGFGDYQRLRADIERVIRMFAGGGLLFCTSHFVQDHCTIEELTAAYDLVYHLVRNVTGNTIHAH